MTPPKCRICGIREHNHRCQGGTPAQRVEERRRWERERDRELGRIATPEAAAPVNLPVSDGGTAPGPARRRWQPPEEAQALAERRPRRWHDDTDSAGEPTEIADYVRKPARFYAPAGQCLYCDRRRAAAAKSMRAVRERGEA